MRYGKSNQWPVISGQQDHTLGRAHRMNTGHRPLAAGFTVTELLIVIGIIILAMALAVPALNLITGNKSTEAATNQLSAMLARARDDAIGLQKVRGLLFYYDQAEDRIIAALVQEVDPASSGTIQADLYLDLVPTDHLTLPKGVSFQTIDDAGSSAAPNDRYLGFNTKNNNSNSSAAATLVPYGGVILFDSHGQLTSQTYALQTHRIDLATNIDLPTPMGVLLYQDDPTVVVPSTHLDVVPVAPAGTVVRSQLGFVLFDTEAFRNQGYTFQDSQIDSVGAGAYSVGSNEYNEELWLDANAVPYLVNRYTGTLLKGE